MPMSPAVPGYLETLPGEVSGLVAPVTPVTRAAPHLAPSVSSWASRAEPELAKMFEHPLVSSPPQSVCSKHYRYQHFQPCATPPPLIFFLKDSKSPPATPLAPPRHPWRKPSGAMLGHS